MKVNELIFELQKYPGDTEVTVWADHGQCDFFVVCTEEVLIHKDDLKGYMMESIPVNNVEKDEREDYIKVVQIS